MVDREKASQTLASWESRDDDEKRKKECAWVCGGESVRSLDGCAFYFDWLIG